MQWQDAPLCTLELGQRFHSSRTYILMMHAARFPAISPRDAEHGPDSQYSMCVQEGTLLKLAGPTSQTRQLINTPDRLKQDSKCLTF